MPRGIRFNPQHDERTRAKIQTSQILNRLQSFVNGEVEMTSEQIAAARILLSKSLPDLSSVQLTGDAANPVRGEVTINIVPVPGKG